MQWHPFPLQPLGHTHLVPTALYKKCPIDSFYSCKTLCYLSFATKSPHKTIKFKGDGFMPAYIVKILVALSFTVIRKYLTNISLTLTDRIANRNRELITFKSGLLSVFLSLRCYAVEPHF